MALDDLILYLRAERCGRLSRAEGLGYRFVYDAAWLEAHPDEQLSMSLPRSEAPFDPARTRPFFFGLLPEGMRRERMERRHRLKAGDDFGLLTEIGGDCPGAVALLPEAADPEQLSPEREPEPIAIDDARLMEGLRRDRIGGAGGRGRKRRLSIPGIQPKEGLWVAPGEDPATALLHLPQGSAASTHILKPGLNEEFRGIVFNEAFCLMLAGRLGLAVPPLCIRAIAGIDCLIVERFDRDARDGRVRRLHQEDCCQALGSIEKYEEDGGPDLGRIGGLIRNLSVPARDLDFLVRAVLFNFLIANADAHAKNYSLFHREGGRREMTPLYDLVATEVFDDITRDLSIHIGGKSYPDSLTRDDFAKAAAALGVRPAYVQTRAAELATAIIPAAMALRKEKVFRGRGKLILDAIRRRVKILSDCYGLGIDHGAEPLEPRRSGGWPAG